MLQEATGVACVLSFSALRREDESAAAAEGILPGAQGGFVDVVAATLAETQLIFRLTATYSNMEENNLQQGRELKMPQNKTLSCMQPTSNAHSESMASRLYATLDSLSGELRTHFKIVDSTA